MVVRRLLLVPVAALLLVGVGCEPDLDTTRQPATPRGSTFGAILYGEACQRVAWLSQLDEQAAGLRSTVDVSGQAYDPVCQGLVPAPGDAPLKLQALDGQRASLVPAIDLTLPKPFLDPLESFLEAIVPLDDDGTMEQAIGSVGAVLQKMIDDRSFGNALARLGWREGYRPLATAAGVVHALFDWPGVDDALAAQLDVLLDDGGAPVAELNALLVAMSKEMGAAQPVADPSAKDRTMRLALDLLLAPAAEAGDGTPRLATVRDARGLAKVALDANGSVPAPFVDADGDGLADVQLGADAIGRFVGADGKPLAVAAPFPVPGKKDAPSAARDAAGRLLGGSGQPVFASVDLDGTVLGALVRESVVLLDPNHDNALGLLYGAGALLGPRASATKDYKDAQGNVVDHLAYNGFATDQSSLLDLAHAYVQLLGAPSIRDALRAAKTLLTTYEDPTSRSLAAMLDVNDRGKADTSAHLPSTSTLFDEMVGNKQDLWLPNAQQLAEFAPIVVRVLRVQADDARAGRRGLVDDMLDALQDPATAGLASSMGYQMLYKDAFTLDQDAWVNDRSGQHVNGSFATMVDRSQPDVDTDRQHYNRSIMQRMAHLIHDANNHTFCNKDGASVSIAGLFSVGNYAACSMFKIDDLALFFALAIARDPNDPHDPLLDDPSRDATTRSKASFIEQMTDSTLRTVVNNVPFTSADDFLQGSLATDIPGFTEFPTPQAAARSLFLDYAHQSSFMQNTIDMNGVLCADGDPFIQVHNDSIFAWEAPDPSGDTFYDAVRPLLRAFVKHDECLQRDPSSGWCMQSQNAVKIFLDLMSLLHEHWASQQSTNMGYPFQASDRTMPRFSTGDGLVTYEPLLGDVMLNSDLVPSMIHLAPTLQAATLDGDGASPPALPALLATAQWALDPGLDHAGLAYRSGATTTVESDGTTQVARITPYYLIADAYAAKRAQLAAAPVDRQGAWRAATATLVDEMLTMERVSGSWRAKNRKLHGVTVALVDFLLGRYDAHAAAGDLDAWVHGNLIGDLGDAIGGPTFAALADLTAKLEASPDALGKLYAMLQPLVDPANEPTFTTTLTGAGDLLQVLLDDADLVPIAHTLASVVDPASGAATAQLKLLKKARALDPNRPMPGDTTHVATLVQVIRNLFQEPAGHGATPIAQLADAIAEVNRCLAHDDQLCGGIASAPAAGSDLIGDDYRHVLGEIRSFLVDEQRGFQRFIEIVKSRNVGAPPM